MKDLDRRISVAPMMDYTDRHCRYFLRLLSPGALLYTEMVAAQALVKGDAERLLAFDPAEHPVALQLGGSEPAMLAAAARMGAGRGYDEINLNCGCPSDRVQNGGFGACLMAEAERVRDCVAAMREAVSVPVTVKCRIGIEPCASELDEFGFLADFISTVMEGGCRVFIVHARKAVLGGLSPKQNREIPPLRYDVVARLRREFPGVQFVLNGGIRTVGDVRGHLSGFDGVMIGREAYQNPYLLAELHRELCEPGWQPPARAEVVADFARYATQQIAEGHRVQSMLRHVLGLYSGRPGARSWRRFLSEQAASGADAALLMESLRIVGEAA